MLSCSQHLWFCTLLNMGLGEVGTMTTLHSSTGEEKERQDETRLKEDVLKMLQLIYVKSHAVQAALQQKPSSQLMKHMVKAS